ncbi:AraC family transcriptional regulator [Pseudoalteromonas rubra]|uniref:AraC family transcriptional regulator n=1 Tax=Pseudoalteromonas rubra TaxID=43658 RepID=A0A5S3WFL5_9GAMM|nr:helix-turn-helix transcriptional regulator [Pseudoalteromonas rubra]TMP24635.1 AraC family transcriptional regulator [Pseudoalteromonas rubra]TMP36292.1 AraC family transcriptional regulator [Pseudoalteromonas rubra]
MTLVSLHYLALATSLTCLLMQLSVKHKQTAHILFAVFCGSLAMIAAKKITGHSVGAYQYLIGMGACATCNCYWLLARSMFRKHQPIRLVHIALAVVIALLVVIQQGYLFANAQWLFVDSRFAVLTGVLSELTTLLSSCVLVLTFWEGCRGFNDSTKTEKAQRMLFLATFGLAVGISKSMQPYIIQSPELKDWTVSIITLFVLVSTQVQLLWHFSLSGKHGRSGSVPESRAVSNTESVNCSNDGGPLLDTLNRLIHEEQVYLQPNLKVADLARALDVPEYRVSRALKPQLKEANFNQFINRLRIEHAQKLLRDPENQHWPVLVIGLESGFASVGPFTRAFKSVTGMTPNQYRKQVQKNEHAATFQ